MEIGKKTVAAGIGLFLLGGFSVYLLMAKSTPAQSATSSQIVTPSQHADQPHAEQSATHSTIAAESSASAEMTHDTFLAQAEARREQQLIDKAEADRLEKLRVIKERSVECKFWKQQQKTSSAVAKIEEKIIEHCTLQTSSEASSAESSTSSAADQ